MKIKKTPKKKQKYVERANDLNTYYFPNDGIYFSSPEGNIQIQTCTDFGIN
jgi:hypothetical protein